MAIFRLVDVVYEGHVDQLEYDDYVYEQYKNVFKEKIFEDLLFELDHWA